ISPSLDFGSRERSKREAAAGQSALGALSAIENDDKIGLLLFHRAAEVYIPPRKGQRHALRVIREVLARGDADYERSELAENSRLPGRLLQRPLPLMTITRESDDGEDESGRRRTNIRFAMEMCQKVMLRRGVIFLVSDVIDNGYVD